MRVTFVISSLSSGGAERVMTSMANYWSLKGWTITIISYVQNNDFYKLEEDVQRVNISISTDSNILFSPILNNFKRIRKLRKEILKSKPDVVISFMDTVNILTLFATLFSGLPIVVSERIDPRHQQLKKIWRFLRSILYPMSSALIVQTQDVLDWARNKVGADKAFVIPNPVNKIEEIQKNELTYRKPYILAVGRLEHQKGFDLLITIFSMVSTHFPELSLIIVGEGSERSLLEEKIQRLNLQDKVTLYGRHPNPADLMVNSSIFALSSRFEGFPNVLLEAMSMGVAVISFDCPSGPRDIIKHNDNGILIEEGNINRFAEAIIELMQNPTFARRLGCEAMKVMETFSQEKIMSRWESIFFNLKNR